MATNAMAKTSKVSSLTRKESKKRVKIQLKSIGEDKEVRLSDNIPSDNEDSGGMENEESEINEDDEVFAENADEMEINLYQLINDTFKLSDDFDF